MEWTNVALVGFIAGGLGTGLGGLLAIFMARPSNNLLGAMLGLSAGIMLAIIWLPYQRTKKSRLPAPKEQLLGCIFAKYCLGCTSFLIDKRNTTSSPISFKKQEASLGAGRL